MSRATGQDKAGEPGGIRIDVYAAQRGEQVGTVRKRIQRGLLDAYKGLDHRWYIRGDVARDATGQDATGQDATRDSPPTTPGAVSVNANARAQLEAIRDEWLAPLVERIEHLGREVGRLESVAAAKDETIAELRRRAEAAEAQLAQRAVGVDATEAAPAATGALATAEPSADTPAPSAGLWQRLRATLLGQ